MLRCVFLVASLLCFSCLTPTHQVKDDGSVPLPISNVAFRFTQQLYNVSIPENSVAKTYAVQSPGSPRMGVPVPPNTFTDLRYRIIEGDKDKFFKAEQRLVGDFCFLFIRIKTGNNDVLNRERKDKYILQVRATASIREGNQKVQYTSETTVVVTVLDTNDLSPLFYPMEYNVTVPEDTPIHKSIAKVIAEDADLGRNGEIYYSFAEKTDKFAIHPVTGIITLTRPLVYNEGTYHELKVLAQDRGVQSQSGPSFSDAVVRIRVKKMNLYAPEIRIRRHPSIVENSNADIYAIVNVSDRDSGEHGEIAKLEIVDGDPDGHFRIRPTRQKGEYNIEVLKLLDREKTPQGYQLQLRAVDKGIPPRESYKMVPVRLTDLNDNAPVFNKEIYDVKVQESAPINTPLIRLKVSDSDEGTNAQVYLEIVGGNEGGEFHLNPETGMLYTAVTLDAESKQFYSLTVSAIDQGNVGTRKQSSAKVKIYVEDTNDNDPIFDKSEMTVWIDENMPAGTSVTTVHAKDKDRGENAYISYLIDNLDKVPFEVEHFSGIIKTKQLLDYESMRREYVLRIRASDWGQPYRRQTEMQLTVKVRDINDNRPQFEKIDCVGNLPRHTPIGSEVITLSAIDFDSGNIISYRIVSGSEDNCFNIDSTSGTITVSCDLNDVLVNERDLNVTATDNTHFADIARVRFKLVNTKRNLFSSGRLLSDDTGTFDCKDTGVARRLTEVLAEAENNNGPIEMEDFPMMPIRYGQNVHAPEFIDFPIQIPVNESVAVGTVLVKLKARDRDLGFNGELVYGISGGDTHSQFDVDMKTGELKVIGYLDREKEYEYFLNITVYDLGKPQKSSSRVLPITVLDINDNAPKFEKSLASFRVTENALNGTAIFRANATDLDEGDNAKVTYSLATDTNDFIVNKVTGVLSVANTLDRERQELYELRIRATDGGGKGPDYPPLFSEAIVRISIDDINDNAPKFSLPNYNVKIREDVPVGTVVAIVTASDPDLGPDGEVNYSLEDSDSDGTFKIDKLSGTIRTTKPLDFEERQVHSLMVFASDRGNPSLSSEATVTVNVVDVNENVYAPTFSDAVLTGSVLENRPTGTTVMNVSAVDLDPPGGDSMVEYSIKDGDGIGLFSIDNEGTIRTTAVLDIETKSHYWLTVFAQDHGVVPLFSSVEIYIEVLNENDNVPLSEHPVYYPVIQEESPAGTVVLQIKATDRDKDPGQEIFYKIAAGNPEGFFAINTTTGVITTTARKLDREAQDEHILESLTILRHKSNRFPVKMGVSKEFMLCVLTICSVSFVKSYIHGDHDDLYHPFSELNTRYRSRPFFSNPFRVHSVIIPSTTTTTTEFIGKEYDGQSARKDDKYVVSDVLASWYDAKKACEDDGLSLVSPIDDNALNQLRQYVSDQKLVPKDVYSGYWLGGRYAPDNTWKWLSGNEISEEAFLPGEPNSFVGEDCIELKNDLFEMGLNNYYCQELRRFICEKVNVHEMDKNDETFAYLSKVVNIKETTKDESNKDIQSDDILFHDKSQTEDSELIPDTTGNVQESQMDFDQIIQENSRDTIERGLANPYPEEHVQPSLLDILNHEPIPRIIIPESVDQRNFDPNMLQDLELGLTYSHEDDLSKLTSLPAAPIPLGLIDPESVVTNIDAKIESHSEDTQDPEQSSASPVDQLNPFAESSAAPSIQFQASDGLTDFYNSQYDEYSEDSDYEDML